MLLKTKQIVNAFQGALPEKQIIEFLEKCLGSKLNEDFTEFYEQIKNLMTESKFEETKNLLLEFISSNPTEIQAISFYLECLIELKQLDEAETFIDSLEEDIKDKEEIKKIIKNIQIIKKNLSGPGINELIEKLQKNPENINLVIEVANKYFSIQKYEDCMELLLKYYPKNKEKKLKRKWLSFSKYWEILIYTQ